MKEEPLHEKTLEELASMFPQVMQKMGQTTQNGNIVYGMRVITQRIRDGSITRWTYLHPNCNIGESSEAFIWVHVLTHSENNQCPLIIYQIHLIKFEKLQCLELNGNQICSLDFLDKIDAPQLMSLGIEENYFISLKPLRKAHFPKLNDLGLGYNYFQGVSELSHLNSPILAEIYLQYSDQATVIQDCRFLFKLQTKNLSNIGIREHEKLKASVPQLMARRKYQHITWI